MHAWSQLSDWLSLCGVLLSVQFLKLSSWFCLLCSPEVVFAFLAGQSSVFIDRSTEHAQIEASALRELGTL